MLGIALDQPIPRGLVDCVKMGTTVATNALLERKGERTLLVVNRGFSDILRIGNQARPRLFDLDVKLPSLLYEDVVEVGGRVDVHGTEIEAPDDAAALAALRAARAKGIQAVAIVLMHAWAYPAHEQRIAEIAREVGFAHMSVSSEVSGLTRYVPRTDTTVADRNGVGGADQRDAVGLLNSVPGWALAANEFVRVATAVGGSAGCRPHAPAEPRRQRSSGRESAAARRKKTGCQLFQARYLWICWRPVVSTWQGIRSHVLMKVRNSMLSRVRFSS